MRASFQSILRGLHLWLIIVLGLCQMSAQTRLALSSASPSGETALLELSLDSSCGVTPVALQWTLRPSPAINTLAVQDGPALAAAKRIVCTGDISTYTCIAVGLNREEIADGVVARISVVRAQGRIAATLEINDAVGVSAAGELIPIEAKGAAVRPFAGTIPPVRRPAIRRRD
jgi:hypothetical protein